MESVEPLWRKLNEVHIQRSVHFSETYANMTWEQRKRVLLGRPAGTELYVELAYETDCGNIGYCMTSATPDRQGEIESIYVHEGWRHRGIGTTLMNDAKKWLDERGVRHRRIWVAWGNQEAFGFYAKFGFYPRRIDLEWKSDQ